MSSRIQSVKANLVAYYYYGHRDKFTHTCAKYKEWMLLVSERGTFTFQAGESSGTVKVGEAVLCPPGIPLHREAKTVIACHSARFFLHVLDEHGEEIEFPYRGKLVFRDASRFLSTLSYLRQSGDDPVGHVEHLVNDILLQYVAENAPSRRRDRIKSPAIIEAVRYINEHYADGISIGLVCSHVGLGQSQFTRQFRKEVGLAPIKYLTRLRIQKVKNLLAETEYTLEEIAAQCGYQNCFYLSRVFSRETGIHPSEFRKLHKI